MLRMRLVLTIINNTQQNLLALGAHALKKTEKLFILRCRFANTATKLYKGIL